MTPEELYALAERLHAASTAVDVCRQGLPLTRDWDQLRDLLWHVHWVLSYAGGSVQLTYRDLVGGAW